MARSLSHYVQALRRRLRSRFVCFGTLRSVDPVNQGFGIGRGTPIDRVYIERFLSAHAAHIRGRVLEVGDRDYTDRFGVGVTKSDVLHVVSGDPAATIVGDLTDLAGVPDGSFDCIILTQTLHYVFDMPAAVHEVHRILAPGGVALVTVPGLSQISRWDMERWGDRWRLTTLSARELFELAFPTVSVEVAAFGNALAATAFVQGIPAERLRTRELDAQHEDYEIVVAIAAEKPL